MAIGHYSNWPKSFLGASDNLNEVQKTGSLLGNEIDTDSFNYL